MMPETPASAGAPYRVLARKYRPQVFADLIGQEAMVRTLSNAIATGRLAQAYMLTGVRGVGKTTTARLIARALNYPGGPNIDTPELTPQCEAILESRHMDVIEMDAASNTGVDNMREVIDSVRYAPTSLRYKIYIIDEVHMLSTSAFNALLKTLEEPPPHVKFIFATTEIRKVPVTILSRCQRFDLKRMSAALLMEHYGKIAKLENVTIDDASLRMVARAAEGSVRDGLSLLDQAIAYGEGHVKADDVANMLGIVDRSRVVALFEMLMKGDIRSAILEIEAQHEHGGDPETILTDLADFTHWVTRLKLVRDQALEDITRTEIEKIKGAELASSLGVSALTRAWQMLLKGLNEVSASEQPLLAAEMVLIRLTHASALPQGEELVKLAQQGDAAPQTQPQVSKVQPLRRETPVPEAEGALAVKSELVLPPSRIEDTKPVATLSSVIDIIAEKRDLKLKSEIERYVRPIRVALGQIEMAMEPGAPQGLPGELSRKLEAWTGRRWIISVAKEGGEKPLAFQRKQARETAFQEARELAAVQAILKAFPGAEITDVRDLNNLKPQDESDEESE
jgi:DNA polymerase III subunit gamma/tau